MAAKKTKARTRVGPRRLTLNERLLCDAEPANDNAVEPQPRRPHRSTPTEKLPKTLRAKLELCATEARHRGQYGAMVGALRELRALDEQEARNAQPPQDGALDELTRRT